MKAHVLTILGAPANLEEALGICELVAKRQPPINDVDVLMFLHRVWGYLDQNFFFNGHKRGSFKAEVGKLWEAAMKKWPNDEKLGREWFWAAIRSADWREAQKVGWP